MMRVSYVCLWVHLHVYICMCTPALTPAGEPEGLEGLSDGALRRLAVMQQMGLERTQEAVDAMATLE